MLDAAFNAGASAAYAGATAAAPRGLAAPPALDAAAVDALLPGPGRDFLLPFLLAALRPDARRWLGPERLGRLAASLRLKETALGQLLDAAPKPPASLGEAGPWSGRRVPMLEANGGIGWVELFWRPDPRPADGGPRPEGGAFVARLALPACGRLELRGRLEGPRLDMVLESEKFLPKRHAADLVESFEATLGLLRMTGKLTVLSGSEKRKT